MRARVRSPRPRVGALPAALAGIALVVLAGCGQQPGVSLQARTQPPLDATLTENLIQIYAGIAVEVDTTALVGGSPAQDGTTVSLTSSNVNVLGADPAPDDGVFVLYGVTPGTADVHVYMNGEAAGDIPATVLDQGTLP